MKKSLIATAGVAAFAAVAMPMSVFAVSNGDNLQDTLKLNISEVCSFTRGTTPHANGTTASGGSWSDDTFTATVTPGSYASLAKSSYAVSCNDADGYQITVAATDFTATNVDATAFPWTYSNTGAIDTTGDSMWFLTVTGTDTDDSGTMGTALVDNIITKRTKTNPAKDSNDAFDITYGAFVDNNQAAGNYTATATYTFAQLQSGGSVQPAS